MDHSLFSQSSHPWCMDMQTFQPHPPDSNRALRMKRHKKRKYFHRFSVWTNLDLVWLLVCLVTEQRIRCHAKVTQQHNIRLELTQLWLRVITYKNYYFLFKMSSKLVIVFYLLNQCSFRGPGCSWETLINLYKKSNPFTQVSSHEQVSL